MKPILTTSYVDPDLDGIACMFAYAEFLNKNDQEAMAGFFGTPHREARFVLEQFNIPSPPSLKNSEDFDRVVLLDCGWMSQGLELVLSPEKVIEVIDHHGGNETHVFANAKIQVEMVGAAATLVAEKFRDGNIPISRESAILLYAGIFSNTLNFKAKVATERDKKAVEWLSAVTEMPSDLVARMFEAKSDMTGPLLAEALESDFSNWRGANMGIGQLEIFGATDLIRDREKEILSKLRRLKEDSDAEYVFLNLLDVENGITFFVTDHESTRQLLHEVLGVRFEGNIAKSDRLILRKELIVPFKNKFNLS